MRRRDEEFERLALPHARSLLRFALRVTGNPSEAEDLVQETLMLAWRGFHQLEADTRASAWLFRILINVSRARNRKARALPETLELTSAMGASSGAGHESLEILQVLDRLAPEQRTAILLAVVEGFTCREIAGILTIPIGTVMSRLSRAREMMRTALLQGERQAR
jgi:RNA polymerase sigma-70 factor (ECF subfamily)